MQHLKKIELRLCVADLSREKYKQLRLLEAASLRDFPFMGGKKAVVLLHWRRKHRVVYSWCAVDDGTDQAKSRFLGGAGK